MHNIWHKSSFFLIKPVALILDMVQYKLNNITQQLILAVRETKLFLEKLWLWKLSKINCRLGFLYRENRFLLEPLRRLLCHDLMQPHFDYIHSAWYPNLNNRLKSKSQILQNKCIFFCLNLNSKAHIGWIKFEKINRLLIKTTTRINRV